MHSSHATSGYWAGRFDAGEFTTWLQNLVAESQVPNPSLALVFTSPGYFETSREMLEIVRRETRAEHLAGCSSVTLVTDGEEREQEEGVSILWMDFGGTDLKVMRVSQEQLEQSVEDPDCWRFRAGMQADEPTGWLLFADPFTLDVESWLKQWNKAFPGVPALGGLATGMFSERRTQLYLDDEVIEEGGIAVGLSGQTRIQGIVAQGCTPIGETWTVTKAERNIIHTIGNRPAYQVLVETFEALSDEDRQRAQGNLFTGLVINEYLEEFHRGDFLIRNIVGIDPKTGAIAVGALARIGQTLQFQLRDATSADEELRALLEKTGRELDGGKIIGGCLGACNGRGSGLFNTRNHDARAVESVLGPIPLAGFFCNGEIGPVGGKNFVHGYTAALALFVQDKIA